MKACLPIAAVVALLVCSIAPCANADGGQILLHQTSQDLTITVFASPEPLTTGSATLSVLLQDTVSLQTISDASLSLSLRSPLGIESRRTLQQPRTGPFRTADFQFDSSGRWRLTVEAVRGNQHCEAATEFNVAASHSRLIVVWTFVSLPWLMVGLFVLRQRLIKRRVSNRQTAAASALYGSGTFS
jgi:hypothetical protein